MDETGVNLSLTRTHARSKKGTRALGSRPYPKGNNITLIGAIARKGFLGGLTVNGGTDQNVFQVFIEKVLIPSLWPGAVIVMDNLPVHKVKNIQELLENVGAKVIYLSFYSPDFNQARKLLVKN